MIDLHTHTDQSDGTLSPRELVEEAARVGLDALAITDHDTFAGYEQAQEHAARASLDLICGVELSTKYRGRSVHLLAYFLKQEPALEFRNWVATLQGSRDRRNLDLVERLHERGVDISIEEVSRRAGKIVGRPHFAAAIVEKGYVSSVQEAFDEYLDESGACFVARDEPAFEVAIAQILAAGGLPVLPHPGRVAAIYSVLEEDVTRMRDAGLGGIEVYHSDHSPSDRAFYAELAGRLGLAVTGGSDFHGAAKPRIALGTGIDGNLNVPRSILTELRRLDEFHN
jgi:predicted metal-dependent phosphoesterase TrpH